MELKQLLPLQQPVRWHFRYRRKIEYTIQARSCLTLPVMTGNCHPVVGVHNIQVMRANREHPAPDNGNGWTYNHQSMLAYWNGQFYMHYLSDPSDEHIPPSQTFLMTSKDGYHWTNR